MTAPIEQPGPGSPGLQVLNLLVRVLRSWRLLFFFPLGVGVATAVVSLLLPPKYVASASFVPEESPSGGVPASLAGLAAQFGLAVPAGASRSPDFYAGLLRARSIADQILTERFFNPRTGDSTALLDYLRIAGANEATRLDKGRRVLNRVLRVGVDRRTGVVGLSVELWHPDIAAAVANRYLQALDDFNIKVRASVGRARREFAEARVEDARQRLRGAEEALLAFRERNLRYEDSPTLVTEHSRLERAANMAQELYTTMAREYELARIAEVNDTPAITVLDSANVPVRRAAPQRKRLVIGAAALAGLVALVLVVVQLKLDDFRSRQPQAATALWSDLGAIGRDLQQTLRRRRAGGSPHGHGGSA